MVGESPRGVITSILGFEKRNKWESTFEDGVIVEAIDVGEVCPMFAKEDNLQGSGKDASNTTVAGTEYLKFAAS